MLASATTYTEGIFNADCSVALLLDTIKKRHQIASEGVQHCILVPLPCVTRYLYLLADEIDLCSEGGVLKNLSSQLSATSGVSFFELRELCLVVRAVPSGDMCTTSRSECYIFRRFAENHISAHAIYPFLTVLLSQIEQYL